MQVSIMYALDHPNVLKFINWYETNHHIWLILEYCTGGDLLKLIRTDQRLPEPAVAQLARDILVGLQYVLPSSSPMHQLLTCCVRTQMCARRRLYLCGFEAKQCIDQ